MLRTISHSRMVHVRFLEVYIHFALIYTTDHIFPILPIKYLINKYGNLTTPFKLARGTKTSVSNLRILFCPCVILKASACVDKKSLNMCYQAQKGFHVIFIGIPQHQKVYLVYVYTLCYIFERTNWRYNRGFTV